MLDTNTSMFGMIREICIKDDDGIVLKRQLFDRRYHLSDVMILPDGEIVQSAFDKEYAQTLVVLQQQVDEERGKMVRRSAQSRLGMPAAQRKSGASVQDLRQVTLGAQSLRPEPAPRRFDAKGARCRQCGDYALEWTVYYGVDSTCLCKKCLH